MIKQTRKHWAGHKIEGMGQQGREWGERGTPAAAKAKKVLPLTNRVIIGKTKQNKMHVEKKGFFCLLFIPF